jgi:phage baseplate assembly protein W
MGIYGFIARYDDKWDIRNSRGQDSQVIEASIFQILGTRKGERVMLPEFGCAIKDLLFEPMDATLKAQIIREAMEALKKWEDRIFVRDIEVVEDNINLAKISIKVSFVLKAGIPIVQQMEVPFVKET